MNAKTLLPLALSLLPATASAQLQSGELILAYPESGASTLRGYDLTNGAGTPTTSLFGSDSSWIASALLPDGRIAVHNNSGTSSIHLFQPDGTFVTSLPVTPSFYASDIDAYADGTIAVCSRFDGILVLEPTLGAVVHTWLPAGMVAPMGCQIQPDQSIWVADLLTFPGNPDGKVWHLDAQGNELQSFSTPFDASDVCLGPDGSVWVVGTDSEVAHYQPDGTLISQWTAQIDSALKSTWSLAVDVLGTVWISGHYDSKVRGYSASGTVLYEFDTVATGNSTFSFIVPGGSGFTRYCFGDGTAVNCPCANNASGERGCAHSGGFGAQLTGIGTADAVADLLTFAASDLVPGQPALLFSARNRVTSAQPAFLFGDGFRCAGGQLARLGVQNADGAGAAAWGPGLRALGGWGPGDTRRFQAWYRDPQGSPCGAGFNTTNGVEVDFLP